MRWANRVRLPRIVRDAFAHHWKARQMTQDARRGVSGTQRPSGASRLTSESLARFAGHSVVAMPVSEGTAIGRPKLIRAANRRSLASATHSAGPRRMLAHSPALSCKHRVVGAPAGVLTTTCEATRVDVMTASRERASSRDQDSRHPLHARLRSFRRRLGQRAATLAPGRARRRSPACAACGARANRT
jgi:hypothetical protein